MTNNRRDDDDGDGSLPAFVMETIPCEECRVLVPRDNWDLHKAHVCQGRQQQNVLMENEPPAIQPDNNNNNSNSNNDDHDFNFVIAQEVLVECVHCGNRVPIQNLELHETRACRVLLHQKQQQQHITTTQDNVKESKAANPLEGWPLRDEEERRNVVEEWECPRCTFLNQETSDDDGDWKCRMCKFCLGDVLEESTATGAAEDEEEPAIIKVTNDNAIEKREEKKTTNKSNNSNDFWQNLVESWIPKEFHELLPESIVPNNNNNNNNKTKKKKRKKASKRRRQQQQKRQQHKHPATPRKTQLGQTPSKWEVRRQRNHHLTLLEQERRQYIQLLKTTRQQVKQLQEKEEEEKEPAELMMMMMMSDEVETNDHNDDDEDDDELSLAAENVQGGGRRISTIVRVDGGIEQCSNTNGNNAHNNSPSEDSAAADQKLDIATTQPSCFPNSLQRQQQEQQQQQQQLEVLRATEELCLYHLEQIRRSSLIQQLTVEIEPLGLSRWKHHLQHLMELYRNASERYVDNIIWERRMHFIQYATLEIMALLELAIWKEQIVEAIMTTTTTTTTTASTQLTDTVTTTRMMSVGAKRSYRRNHDICIICQSILPFLGRPQTPSLRAL